MKPILYILCGPAGCGKSTFASHFGGGNGTIWVSRDAIRFRYLDKNPGSHYFDFEEKVYKDFIYEILQGLTNGYDAIADATHLTPKARKKLTNEIDNYENAHSFFESKMKE